MADQPVSVSVIIVTHNSHATLTACLEALPKACGSLVYEIIVIDNKSRDETISAVRTAAGNAHVIELNRNVGFGAACNAGARTASGEYLLFVNPDAILDPGAVKQLVEAQNISPDVAFCVPRLRYADGRFQSSCRKLPTIGNMIFSRGSVIRRVLAGGESGSDRYTLPDYATSTAVEAVAGTVALIRRTTFLSADGFDPRFFLYMEDTDLCLRLGRQGLVHRFVPAAGAVHSWGRGSAAGKARRIWHHHMSVWKYFLKHFPTGFSVVVLPFLLLVNGAISLVLPDRRADE